MTEPEGAAAPAEPAAGEPAGGEPACLLALVCAECGALAEQAPPTDCWRCGALVERA